MQAVDQRGSKSLGCFQPREVMACQMSYQLSDLKLVLVAVPATLANQSDAQVFVELRGLRATSRHCNSLHGTAPWCGWTSSARLRMGVLLSYSLHGVFEGSCVFGSTVLKALKQRFAVATLALNSRASSTVYVCSQTLARLLLVSLTAGRCDLDHQYLGLIAGVWRFHQSIRRCSM
jgi:hypothetical protein